MQKQTSLGGMVCFCFNNIFISLCYFYVEKKTGLENYNLTEKVFWKTLDDKPATIKGRIIEDVLT